MPAIDSINRLIEKVKRGKELPNRQECIELALELCKDAINAKRTFINKAGEAREYAEPNLTAANKSAELVATLSLAAKPAAEVGKPEENESELAKMGYKLVRIDESGVPEGERVQ
jgi:hypothetical protein